MFENIRNIIQGKKVDLVAVEGENTITRIEYIHGAERLPNSAINLYDLLGYIIQSDTVELYQGKKFMGRGYISDLAGMTVDINRIVPAASEYSTLLPTEPAPTEGAIIKGEAIQGARKPLWSRGPERKLPVMILEGAPRVSAVRFDYLREIDGAVIDDERLTRYTVEPGTRIEIKMPDGSTGAGYVCDPSGKTIRIQRAITVKITVKKVIDGKETEEEVISSIKFAGVLGKLASGDRLPKLLSGMPGREGLLQIAVAGLVGLCIGAFLL